MGHKIVPGTFSNYLKYIIILLILTTGIACGGVGSVGGGGGGSGGGGDGDGDDDGSGGGAEESSFQDGPVTIPITISKALPAIDPSTVIFTEGTNNLIKNSKPSTRRTAAGSGGLSGIVYKTDEEQDVCCYEGDNLIDKDTTSDGAFECSGVTPPTAVTTCVCVDDDSDGDIDTCGPPITASISTAGNVHVIMTNIDMEPTARLAVSPLGKIAFCATAAAGNSAIGVIPKAGELPVELLEVDTCDQIRIKGYTTEEEVVFADITQNKIFTVDTLGTATQVDTTEDDVAYLRVRGNDLAYATDTEGLQISLNGTAQSFNTSDSTLSYRVFDFIDDSTFVVSEARSNGLGSRLFEKSVSSTAEISEVDISSYPTSISCNTDGSCFALIDDGLAIGNNDLGEYVAGSGFTTRIAARFLLNEQVCDTGAVFEQDYNETLGNPIGFYNTSGQIVYSSRLGSIPLCDPTNENHSFFLCASEDTGQICSFRPDFENVVAGQVTHFFFLAITAVNAGTCSGGFTVVTTDGFGALTATPPTSAVTINLSVSGTNGAFYSTSACSGTPMTQIPIHAGSSMTDSFYFKADSAGTVYFFATDSDDILTKAGWKILVQ